MNERKSPRVYDMSDRPRAPRTMLSDAPPGMRQCPRCKRMLSVEHFIKDRTRSDGLYPYCRECKRAHNQERREKDKATRKIWEARPEVHARLRERDKLPQYQARHKRFYERHRAENTVKCREYRHRNPERIRAINARIRAKNKEVVTAWKRRYYYERGGREMGAAWRANHRASRLAAQMARADRLRQAEGSFTGSEWEALKDQYDHTCLRCQRRETEIVLTPDHVIPLIKGGRNDIGNIQPLCRSCNSTKATHTTDYRVTWKGDNSERDIPSFPRQGLLFE